MTQNIFLDSIMPVIRSSRGLLRSGKALIPTCNALDVAISPTCRSTTWRHNRIDSNVASEVIFTKTHVMNKKGGT